MSVMLQAGFDAALAEAAGTDERLIAVMGVRGGCGATAVAMSLAWMIGNGDADTGALARCLMVDLDLHFGSAAMALGVEPGAGLMTMLADPEAVDARAVTDALRMVNNRFGLIAAQLPMTEAAVMTPTAVMDVLAVLQRTAAWVVADVPRGLDAVARQLLGAAGRVVLVTPPSLEGLRDTRRLLAWLVPLRHGPAPLVVVNGGGELGRNEFESMLGQPVAAWIGAMCGAAAAASAHALPLAAVAGGRAGNPFAALAVAVVEGAVAPRRTRLPAWWPKPR